MFLHLYDCIIFLGMGWLLTCPVPSHLIPQREFFLSYLLLIVVFSNVEFNLLGKWSLKLEHKLQIIVQFGQWTPGLQGKRWVKVDA